MKFNKLISNIWSLLYNYLPFKYWLFVSLPFLLLFYQELFSRKIQSRESPSNRGYEFKKEKIIKLRIIDICSNSRTRSIANRISRKYVWNERIRGEATMGFIVRMTRKLEVVTNGWQRALHTRFGHGSTFLFLPVAAAANGTFTASWSSSPRVSRHGGGAKGEARRGNSRSRFTRSCTFRYGEGTKVSDSRIQRRASSFVRNRGRRRRWLNPPPSFFFPSLLSSPIIDNHPVSRANGESFNDDLDDLNELSVNMLISEFVCVCVRARARYFETCSLRKDSWKQFRDFGIWNWFLGMEIMFRTKFRLKLYA